jgi:hypothetical protein
VKTILFFILLLTSVVAARSAEVGTSVKYVTIQNVYLDAGRASGILSGDSAHIQRGEEHIATLLVTFVSDNSASCAVSEGTPPIQAGDSALVYATGETNALSAKESPAELSTIEPLVTEERPREVSAIQANRLTGRIGLDYLVQDDREEYNYDYVQPSLSIRAKVANIQGSHYSLSVRTRMRNTIRNRESYSTPKSETSHRIYEAALRYENPDSRVECGIGRMIAQELRGIGYLDGAYAKYRMSTRFSMGVFGGTEPDLENTDFQTDVTKGGVYAAYDRRTSNSARATATLALAGSYQGGQVNREFLYQQLNYYYGSHLSFYESAEINFYRDWLKEKEDASIALAGAQINARYSPSRPIAFSLGYDNRRNFYTYDARSVPDSLFDDALRTGWRGSVEVKLARKFSTEIGGSLRKTEGKADNATSSWLRINLSDVLSSGVGLLALARAYSSEYSDGLQPSITISKSLFRELYSSVQLGANSYTLSSTDTRIEQNWLRLNLDLSLGKRYYASLDAEAARGSNQDANTLTVGLGIRL